jgi:hypothetical protein
MKKILLMSAFLTVGMFIPEKARATIIVQGFASITTRLGGGTLYCNGAPTICCTISGNNITINHWSGLIHGTLDFSVLPPVLPENYPIEFESEEIIPQG